MSLLISQTYEECKTNIHNTVTLLDSLGFTIHSDKSILEPTQIIDFLGFTIDSRTRCVKLTENKVIQIVDLC